MNIFFFKSNKQMTPRDFSKNDLLDLIKYLLIAVSMPIGLFISLFTAFRYIDFQYLLQTIETELTNSELFDYIVDIFSPWYKVSFLGLIPFVVVLISFIIIKPSENESDNISFFSTIRISIMIISLTQLLLPLILIPLAICVSLLYLIFISSMITKNIISYSTYLFALLLEKFCNSSGLSITYGDFIGQKNYSNFLTLITFFVSVPYLLNFLLKLTKKLMNKITGTPLISIIFRPVEFAFKINNIRYCIYLFLFFTSVLTYSMNITSTDYVLMLAKESLLEFVLLDTITYSLYNNVIVSKERKKIKKFNHYVLPFKYDLEFISSALITTNIKNTVSRARIHFTDNINFKINIKTADFDNLQKLLKDLSCNFYEINTLEEKIHEALKLILLLESELQS